MRYFSPSPGRQELMLHSTPVPVRVYWDNNARRTVHLSHEEPAPQGIKPVVKYACEVVVGNEVFLWDMPASVYGMLCEYVSNPGPGLAFTLVRSEQSGRTQYLVVNAKPAPAADAPAPAATPTPAPDYDEALTALRNLLDALLLAYDVLRERG
ncbi:MAG: hypothetical protein NZM42_11955 [Gemmatales bacterium]|nr:hypothetical protein [Gemmatales bacterium]